MTPLRLTLLADGTSDQSLLPIIDWVVGGIPAAAAIGFTRDFARPDLIGQTGGTLAGRMRAAMRLYPCDVLFVHRDAEREPPASRLGEIDRAMTEVGFRDVVSVVPVRMTEAWLLFEEAAIRRAADNPNGAAPYAYPV